MAVSVQGMFVAVQPVATTCGSGGLSGAPDATLVENGAQAVLRVVGSRLTVNLAMLPGFAAIVALGTVNGATTAPAAALGVVERIEIFAALMRSQ